MNKMKFMVLFMSVAMIFSGCASMNNTGKGAAIGGGSGAALGAILGGVIGKGKGAAIGAAIGTAVGAGTGALIGKKMDKAAAEAKQIEGAQVEQITDNNGLKAVKVTFDSGILFTNSQIMYLTRTVIWTYLSMDIPTIKDGETVRQNKVARKT